MTMSKNKGIEEDNNDKDKQYQKREDMIFSFFRKLRKIEFWTYIAYVIVLTICFQSVMVMVLTLLFLGYFRKLWRICDLISIYYLPWRIAHVSYRLKSLTNWGFAVGSNQTFVEEVLLSYLWLLRLKSKLQFCKKIIHVICKMNVCYFWSFRLWIRI